MAIPLATNLLHFYLNELFKNMVCILALLGLATVLATFQKIGQVLFQIMSGLYYKTSMIVIYDRNDSGQYHKTTITIVFMIVFTILAKAKGKASLHYYRKLQS
jgi:hypothetical protein